MTVFTWQSNRVTVMAIVSAIIQFSKPLSYFILLNETPFLIVFLLIFQHNNIRDQQQQQQKKARFEQCQCVEITG